jgi:hypothetical protein
MVTHRWQEWIGEAPTQRPTWHDSTPAVAIHLLYPNPPRLPLPEPYLVYSEKMKTSRTFLLRDARAA